MQTLTCPWNIFVNEPVADELSLPSPLDPHLDKCHGLPNGRISMFFAIQEEVRLSFCCLGDYKSIASCSILSIPNERTQSLLPSSGLAVGSRVTCALIGSR